MTDAVNVKPIFDAMPLSLNKEAAKDANVTYQFNIEGEGGGQFAVTIKNGACSVQEEAAATPDVIISASASDYVNIVSGMYPFGLAYINGRLKVNGDLRQVIRMGAYFAPTT